MSTFRYEVLKLYCLREKKLVNASKPLCRFNLETSMNNKSMALQQKSSNNMKLDLNKPILLLSNTEILTCNIEGDMSNICTF